jgi:hypothetical protein
MNEPKEKQAARPPGQGKIDEAMFVDACAKSFCPFNPEVKGQPCDSCRLFKVRRHAEHGECTFETIVYHLQGLDEFRRAG